MTSKNAYNDGIRLYTSLYPTATRMKQHPRRLVHNLARGLTYGLKHKTYSITIGSTNSGSKNVSSILTKGWAIAFNIDNEWTIPYLPDCDRP